jgi:twinkle protein
LQIIPDTIDFAAYLKETDAKTHVKPASVWLADLIDRLRNPDQTKKVYLPWEKCRQVFNFRKGEVTLWAGQNGHGKTQIASQVMLSLMGQDEKAVVASFEMKPQTTMQRLARMFAGTNPFSPEYQGREGADALVDLYNEFGQWTDGKLWIYDQQGTVSAARVIGMARYCAKELGIGHIVIDSLMKCVRGEDDYNGQKEFVDELTSLARDNQVHVHLIHHTRKPANEAHIPDKYDNKGSGAITDLVDNVMMVWRNKPKEDAFKAMGAMSKLAGEADAMLFCRKQRNGEDEPSIKLWFDRDSQQYKGEAGDELMYFPNFPHRPTPSYGAA